MSEPQLHFAAPAEFVRVGDLVQPSTHHAYVVAEISRVTSTGVPAEILAGGGWVSLKGDSTDGYYEQTYGDRQDYYAAPDELVNVHRPVSAFAPLTKDRSHDHSTDGLVGYVVRETIVDGEVIRSEDGRVGRDVAVFECGTSYGQALAAAKRYRERRGSYAVVDGLFACGCRDGQR